MPVPVVVLEILLGILDWSRPARPCGARRVPRLLLEPRARHALLLRGLRDRLRKDPRQSPPACRPGLAVVARLGLLTRRVAHADGPRAVAPVHGLCAGHHRHRNADTGPERRRRATDPLRHLSARSRRGGGVRPDHAHHAGVLDEECGHERADPDRLRHRRGSCGRDRRPRCGARLGVARSHSRDERPAGHPHRGGNGVRARDAGRLTRPGRAARRLRGGSDRAPRVEGT